MSQILLAKALFYVYCSFFGLTSSILNNNAFATHVLFTGNNVVIHLKMFVFSATLIELRLAYIHFLFTFFVKGLVFEMFSELLKIMLCIV